MYIGRTGLEMQMMLELGFGSLFVDKIYCSGGATEILMSVPSP